MLRRSAILLIMMLILAACQDDSSDSKPDVNATATPNATQTPIPTDLSIWFTDPTMQESYATVIDQFHRAYPNISTSLMLQDAASFPETVQQSLKSGGEPDVLLVPVRFLSFLADHQNLLPLPADDINTLSMFVPSSAVQMGRIDQQYYAFPVHLFVPVLFSHATLTPSIPDNYDALMMMANESIVQPNFQTTSAWLPMATGANPRIQGTQLNVNQVGVTAYLQRLVDLANRGAVLSDDFSAFANGEKSLYLGTTADLPALRRALGDNLQITPIPDFANLPLNNLLAGDAVVFMVSLNATESDLQAAMQLLAYLLLPDTQTEMSRLSGYLPLQDPAHDVIVQRTVFYNDRDFHAGILPVWDAAIQQVITGQLAPADAAQTLFTP